MVEVIGQLDAVRVRANLDAVREQIDRAIAASDRSAETVTIVAAVKYVAASQMPKLVAAGLEVAGENRAQDLAVKVELAPELRWHFIGHLQSRKVKEILPHVELIHSVCSDSVVTQLERHSGGGTPILVEVNVSGEEAKSGITPERLGEFITRCRDVAGADVRGLMTMPPLAADPQQSRIWFRRLAELAAEHGLGELSMGTTQDFAVAVEEGATMVRIGSRLFR